MQIKSFKVYFTLLNHLPLLIALSFTHPLIPSGTTTDKIAVVSTNVNVSIRVHGRMSVLSEVVPKEILTSFIPEPESLKNKIDNTVEPLRMDTLGL